MSHRFLNALSKIVLGLLACQIIFGWPAWPNRLSQESVAPKKAEAATFTLATGSYIGTGTDDLHITGIGFRPDFVMIKDSTAGGTDGINFKTSVMTGQVSSVLGDADADTASDAIQSLDSDGFTVGLDADINAANSFYSYIAVGGSDCTSSGTFCVGSYTGNGTSVAVTSVGFQPTVLMIKRSGASVGALKTTAMGTNTTVFFDTTSGIASGTNTAVRTLDATGFTVGSLAAVNTSGNTNYYVAFKNVTNKMAQGTYSGTGLAHDITGFGASGIPDFVMVKDGRTASSVGAVYSAKESNGDYNFQATDLGGVVGGVQALKTNAFTVGTLTNVNTSAVTYYWFGFGGSSSLASNSATYAVATGYYIGTGVDDRGITGVGFEPDIVMIKSSTTAGAVIFRTSDMTGDNSSGVATATAANMIQSLDSDGFTLGTVASVNSVNVIYYWTAVKGSDCTSSGVVCVGHYVGSGVTAHAIKGVGFTPDIVISKTIAGTTAAMFRTSSMASNIGEFFAGTAEISDGTAFQTLDSGGFTLGTSANLNAVDTPNWFIAFKKVTNQIQVGSYSGNSTDNRSIAGFGATATPDFALIKGTGLVVAVANIADTDGDNSLQATALANGTDQIQLLQADGFQLGVDDQVNLTGSNYYWFAFGGGAALPSGSGDYEMATGSYTATGSTISISSLGFQPDLVIVKGNDTQVSVFRTSAMKGDTTAHMASATANFTGGVTSLDSNGFTIGTSLIVNTSPDVYYWEAFGNAYSEETRTGSSNFAVGAYYGNGLDTREIVRTGADPDFVTVKRSGATAGGWHPSSAVGDNTVFFAATAAAADWIQKLNSDGFEVGTNAGVNTAANVYWWFAFKTTSGLFNVGSYTGNNTDNRNITGLGFQPDEVWVKKLTAGTARAGAHRSDTITDDHGQMFTGTVNTANTIQSFASDSFQVGTDTTVNESTSTPTYEWAAWAIPVSGSLTVDIVDSGGISVGSPSVTMNSAGLSLSCQTATGSFGTSSQKLRVNNTTVTPGWIMSVAASSTADLWSGSGHSYDFNSSTGSGCTNGQMTLNASGATLTPQGGCSATGITKGGSTAFVQGSTDSITLLTAGGSADTSCYWDLTNVAISQKIPANQAVDSYSISMVLSIIAN